ncbi:hypothetical protein ASG52_25730 [Methylobacterium sp. Leaf456]|nr:hypothetical protein ASG52_25730 [Methylobacterium sp. Leaf456]
MRVQASQLEPYSKTGDGHLSGGPLLHHTLGHDPVAVRLFEDAEDFEEAQSLRYLRHYIALSQAQFKSKYLSRRYSGDDLRRNWHANRLTIDEDNLAIRSGPAMRRLPSPLDHDKFDLSRPVDTHFWQWPKAEPVDGPCPDAADPPKAPHRGEE